MRTEQEKNGDPEGLVGLQNLGNTCYMNGALQALSNCQQLTRFVLDCPGFVKDTGLSRSYSELIKEIWSSQNSQYAVPTSIIRNIKCIYPAFRGCTQQDTQEFLRCFLEQLHDELKQPVIETNNDSNLPSSSGESQRSIVSDTFEFKISSSVVCSNCNNISTTKETFKDLSIPIPSRDHPYYQTNNDEIESQQDIDSTRQPAISDNRKRSRHKLTSHKEANDSDDDEDSSESSDQQLSPTEHSSGETTSNLASDEGKFIQGNELRQSYFIDSIPLARWFLNWFSQIGNWFWGPQVTLNDCLSIFFGTDPLEGDNEYSCEVCTKKNKGVKYLQILELPEVLCIHFKRYESVGSAKITTHVSFPITGLDLAPFMSENCRPQCTTYNLIACICHHGSALLTGHYTTYALNCYDDQWYEFDDQYVSCASSYQVENSEAYILFYQKSRLDDSTDRQRVKASKLLKKSLHNEDVKTYFISRPWVAKFNTFVEPGPITNHDFLCKHEKVPKKRQKNIHELCHPISETVWNYLEKLHGGGPICRELIPCDTCE